MEPPIMTFDLLQSLWDRLARIGAPVVEEAAPGLTEDEIRDALAQVGLEAPDEVMVWWQWRNGTRSGVCRGSSAPGRSICPSRELIPLQEALAQRHVSLEVASTLQNDFKMPAKDIYPPQWLPLIAYDEHLTVIDCGSGHRFAPVHHYNMENLGLEGCHVTRAPSIAAMVKMWIDAMDAGLWTYNPIDDVIDRDWDDMPEAWRLSGFM